MEEFNQHRRLAAVLFADIAGYTAMMQTDERQTMEKLDRFKSALEEKSEMFGGQIINFYGDGCLIVFDNATQAVRCTLQLQKIFNGEPTMPVRMGVHLGDVVFKENNAFGDSVNIASRIESAAVPGSILFSDAVMNQIRNHPEFRYVHLGSFEFKNLEDPIQVYALSNDGLHVPLRKDMKGKLKDPQQRNRKVRSRRIMAGTAMLVVAMLLFGIYRFTGNSNGSHGRAIRSLAILPFTNISNDPDLLYLSDGIPENLINRLSGMEGIRIFPRNATFHFRDSLQDIPRIRNLLTVDAVFTGQLSLHDNQLVLNCQPIDAENQSQIWGDRIKSPVHDILDMEDQLVVSLLNPLRIQLSGQTNTPAHTIMPDAYTHYLKGRPQLRIHVRRSG